MARYERYTAAPASEALRIAEEVLTQRIPLRRAAQDAHSVRLTGEDGTVTVTAHRHGLDTLVVAETDGFRTSRVDIETQYYLNSLPYQPGDIVYQPGDRIR